MTQVLAVTISPDSFNVAHKPAFFLVGLFGVLQTALAVYSGWISVASIRGKKRRHYVGFGAFGALLLVLTVAIAYVNDHNQVSSDRIADNAKHASEVLHNDYLSLYNRTLPSNAGTTPEARSITIREVHEQIGQALAISKPTPVIPEISSGARLLSLKLQPPSLGATYLARMT